jgi:hypothetical protein
MTCAYPKFASVIKERENSLTEKEVLREQFRSDLKYILENIRYVQYCEEWAFNDKPYFFQFYKKRRTKHSNLNPNRLYLGIFINYDFWSEYILLIQQVLAEESYVLEEGGYKVEQLYDHESGEGLTGLELDLSVD